MVKNAIGGIHPKTIVPITGKAKTEVREYIVKTWGRNSHVYQKMNTSQ